MMQRQTRSSARNRALSTVSTSSSSASSSPVPTTSVSSGEVSDSVSQDSVSRPGPSSRKSLQLNLLFGLKRHIDLMYKQVNLQKACIKNVNKFQKFLKNNTTSSTITDEVRQQHEKFDRDYRYCKKKLLAKKWKRNSLTEKEGVGNIYDTIDDLLKNFLPEELPGNSSRVLSESGYGSDSEAVNETNTTENDNENDLVFFVCPTAGCDEIFNNREVFDEHLLRKHQIVKEVASPVIPPVEETPEEKAKKERRQKLKNRKKERIHQNRLLKQKQKYMQWKIESIILKKKAALDNMRKYSETLSCNFKDCDYVAKYPTLMIMHLKTFHDQQPVECGQCFEAFPDEQLLEKHRLEVHEKEEKLKQEQQEDEQQQQSTSSDKSTKNAITKPAKARKCNWPNCGYSCNLLSNLRRHRALKHGQQQQLKKAPTKATLTPTSSTTTTASATGTAATTSFKQEPMEQN